MDILARIENIVQNHGKRPVQFFDDSVLTYEELWKKSDQLARHFLKIRNDRKPVLVLGNKTKDIVISFLAATKAGKAYIPVDEVMPGERIRHMIAAAKPSILVNTLGQRDAQSLAEDMAIIDFNRLQSIYEDSSSEPFSLESQVKKDEVYYILFTSGSTGIPKGVQILRSNLEDFLDWTVPTHSYESFPHIFLNQAPFSFDLSVYELYNALVSGGSFVSLTNDHIRDLKRLFEAIYKHCLNLNVWVSTPSFLLLCLKDSNFTGATFPALKHFIIIGEAFPKNLAKDLLEKFPNTIIYNLYGPTEATVATTEYEITAESLIKYDLIPIGYSKPRSQILIQNGEIVICGPNVGPGYVNNREKTDKVFFNINGMPAYRTGDKGFVNEEGLIFCEGRLDLQIKLNGYRIELGEIENNLDRIEFIKSSCVIPKVENGKIQWICGFLVLDDKEKARNVMQLRKELKTLLLQHLPAYMIPKQFICLDSLPFTNNGKIDRKLLGTMI